MKIGDLVKWVGGSHHNLQGIVVDRCGHFGDRGPRGEVKVIWDIKGLGSLKQKPGGSWQCVTCVKVISSVESEDENR